MATGFGIIGCGMIAHFHARAIADLRGARLVGCYNQNAAKALEFAEEHDCVAFDTLEAMLADPAVDVVNICTPSGAHMESAVAAARAGKHVVVEKPLEVTLRRCDRIIDACRSNNVKLCTIFPSRFSPVNAATRKAIQAGRFGRLTLGDTFVKWWRSQEYYDSGGWRGTWKLDGGGAFMNQAIHNVDLLYWMMGDVAEVCAVTGTLAHERIEVEDTAVACVRFQNGALGVLEASTSTWPGLLKKTEIHGTAGSVIIEQDHLRMWEFEKKRAQDDTIRSRFSADSATTGGAADPGAISYAGHLAQLKDFVAAIRSDRAPAVDGAEGRKSVEIILAIYKAAWSGKRVTLPLKSDPRPPKQ